MESLRPDYLKQKLGQGAGSGGRGSGAGGQGLTLSPWQAREKGKLERLGSWSGSGSEEQRGESWRVCPGGPWDQIGGGRKERAVSGGLG